MIAEGIVKDGGIFIPNIIINSEKKVIRVNIDFIEDKTENPKKFEKYIGTWNDNDNQELDKILQEQRKIDEAIWNV
ncbi:MAG: hypothetical protein A2086_15850 [Spirochaetes bacterium GWD1_27_9]|nr:MAG: hypothetical protein A2Z98_11120 [Spirochaetes bacterium GWB1_27_13]OHD27081.1 MAG: hypothetical protein A2Y34_11320 [Spirochaetes bacterium GWC1_27_15]OHD42852.1 MAG: hypothetical protein A2086_15850 [Spirochaetes bacterium GWD1_27_9]